MWLSARRYTEKQAGLMKIAAAKKGGEKIQIVPDCAGKVGEYWVYLSCGIQNLV